MQSSWLRLVIGSGILIALLCLVALEIVSSRIPVDHSATVTEKLGRQ